MILIRIYVIESLPSMRHMAKKIYLHFLIDSSGLQWGRSIIPILKVKKLMLTEQNYMVCSLSQSQGVAEPGIQTLTKKPELLTTMLR